MFWVANLECETQYSYSNLTPIWLQIGFKSTSNRPQIGPPTQVRMRLNTHTPKNDPLATQTASRRPDSAEKSIMGSLGAPKGTPWASLKNCLDSLGFFCFFVCKVFNASQNARKRNTPISQSLRQSVRQSDSQYLIFANVVGSINSCFFVIFGFLVGVFCMLIVSMRCGVKFWVDWWSTTLLRKN